MGASSSYELEFILSILTLTRYEDKSFEITVKAFVNLRLMFRTRKKGKITIFKEKRAFKATKIEKKRRYNSRDTIRNYYFSRNTLEKITIIIEKRASKARNEARKKLQNQQKNVRFGITIFQKLTRLINYKKKKKDSGRDLFRRENPRGAKRLVRN